MEALILAALAAVVYWGLCTARERQRGCPGGRGGTETAPAAEKEPWDPEAAAAALEPAPAGLLAVMDHPDLGGPGFLSVRFPRPGEAEASCRFPSLQGTLYGLADRGEADRRTLEDVGVPRGLLDLGVTVEAEGGGVTALTVLCPVPPLPEGTQVRALWALAEALGRRFPGCTASLAGREIFLSNDD